jgi:hypothetical protein
MLTLYMLIKDRVHKMQESPKCSVFKLECRRKNDRAKVAVLQELASGQRINFHDIFPWEGRVCDDKHVFVYVALENYASHLFSSISIDWLERNRPLLCGWLNVRISEDGGRKMAFISDVTTRAAKDITYRGVGTTLLSALDKETDLDFIYLYPLSSVVGFYKKMGYVQMSPDTPHMLKVLRSTPTPMFIANIQRTYQATIAEDAQETPIDMLDHFKDDVSRSTMRTYRRIVKANPDVIYELIALLQEGDDDALEEWMANY